MLAELPNIFNALILPFLFNFADVIFEEEIQYFKSKNFKK
jgi:hypothetical protein